MERGVLVLCCCHSIARVHSLDSDVTVVAILAAAVLNKMAVRRVTSGWKNSANSPTNSGLHRKGDWKRPRIELSEVIRIVAAVIFVYFGVEFENGKGRFLNIRKNPINRFKNSFIIQTISKGRR